MAYPPDYDPDYSFTGFQQSQGGNTFPGTQLDNELAMIQAALDGLDAFIQGSFNAEGILKPGKTADAQDFDAAIQEAEAQAAAATASAVSAASAATNSANSAAAAVVSASSAATQAVNASNSASSAAASAALFPAVTATQYLRANAAGTAWETRTAAETRTDIGLGSIATQSAAAVAITGGTLAGMTLQLTGGATAFTTRSATNNIVPSSQVLGTGGTTGTLQARFSNDTFPTQAYFAKSRGATVGAHVAVQAADELGRMSFGGSDGTKINEGARVVVAATGAPGTDYTPTRVSIWTSPGGTTAPADRVAVDENGNLQMGGSNAVVGSNRHFLLRSYTAAALPVATTAGEMIQVSDGAAGFRLAVSNGSIWRFQNGRDASAAALNTQTGASYTLVLADAHSVVEMNNAGANTLTVPPNSTAAFPIGTQIDLCQLGAGQTTVAAGAGVTIRSASGNLKIVGQYSTATLRKRAADEWVLSGSLAA